MTAPKRPPTPKGLGTRGARFWRATVTDYELSGGELQLLAECCQTLDTLDTLAARIAQDGTMVRGSAGQDVLHPAISEARQQRTTLHRLLAALALPDDDGATVPAATHLRAVTAAQARWAGVDTEAAARRREAAARRGA